MSFSPQQWHERFQEQAGWTEDLRTYLYAQGKLAHAQRVLEVGCGTGVLLEDLLNRSQASIYGIDIAWHFLQIADRSAPEAHLCQADAFDLPFSTASFDMVVCHFFLLWLGDPLEALLEMRRVCRPGGSVLAMAEPDYEGRIDHPPELAQLGTWQREALRRQGAVPETGRRLGELFAAAGLEAIERGVIGGQWPQSPPQQAWQSEWETLQEDLRQIPDVINSEKEKGTLARLKKIDAAAWASGARILFVPTFYASGRVPGAVQS